MKLFARIQDPNGGDIDGWVVAIFPAESIDALEADVGSDVIGQFVEAPHGFCVGWRYENGVFVDPKGS